MANIAVSGTFTIYFESITITTFQILNDQILNMLYHQKVFNDLLIKRKKLYKTKNSIFRNSKPLSSSSDFILFVRVFAILCTSAVIYSVLFSLYSQQFIVPVWYPKQYPLLHTCLFYIQWLWLIFICYSQYVNILFFNSLYEETALHFKFFNCVTSKLLKEYVEAGKKDSARKLRKVMVYQRFLIKYKVMFKILFCLYYMNFSYTQQLRNALSLRLLIMLTTIALVTCVELYTISSK